jgi:hypothetical protein
MTEAAQTAPDGTYPLPSEPPETISNAWAAAIT